MSSKTTWCVETTVAYRVSKQHALRYTLEYTWCACARVFECVAIAAARAIDLARRRTPARRHNRTTGGLRTYQCRRRDDGALHLDRVDEEVAVHADAKAVVVLDVGADAVARVAVVPERPVHQVRQLRLEQVRRPAHE